MASVRARTVVFGWLLALSTGCSAPPEGGDVEAEGEVGSVQEAASISTGRICGWGVSDCTKCVNGVESMFNAANASSAGHMHGRLGSSPSSFRSDELDHNQGIGRLYHPDGRYVVLTRSMSGNGQILMFKLNGYSSTQGELGSSGSHSTTNTVVWQHNDIYDRNHPDGLSVMGNYFVHGSSCSGGEKCTRTPSAPRVYVWDASDPTSPRRVLNFDLANWLGDVPATTAAAAAATMVKLSNSQYLVVVKSRRTNAGRVVRFFQGSSLTDKNTWSQVSVLSEASIEAWDDGDFNYQHISAVTDCFSGAIYLVATKGDTFGECDSDDSEVARLYKLGLSGSSYTLTSKGHRYFKCLGGDVNFSGAAGVYVSRDGRLNFYTGEKEFHEVDSGVKVKFREFYSGTQ